MLLWVQHCFLKYSFKRFLALGLVVRAEEKLFSATMDNSEKLRNSLINRSCLSLGILTRSSESARTHFSTVWTVHFLQMLRFLEAIFGHDHIFQVARG